MSMNLVRIYLNTQGRYSPLFSQKIFLITGRLKDAIRKILCLGAL